jgi:hypothetical protein
MVAFYGFSRMNLNCAIKRTNYQTSELVKAPFLSSVSFSCPCVDARGQWLRCCSRARSSVKPLEHPGQVRSSTRSRGANPRALCRSCSLSSSGEAKGSPHTSQWQSPSPPPDAEAGTEAEAEAEAQ